MLNQLKRKVKKILNIEAKPEYLGGDKYCPVCDNKLKYFLPLPDEYRDNAERNGYPYFGQNEHLNVKEYSCPNCRASDRDRLYAAYLKNFYTPTEKNTRLLHIAPSWPLEKHYLSKSFTTTTTDLEMPDVDIHANIEDMNCFEDNEFGFFICSHVLEHVNSPDKALSELKRILKVGGEGIIMVPIIPTLEHTVEDPSHKTDEERLKHYGQADHLRLFAKSDFTTRITNAGFDLNQLDASNTFGLELFEKLGIRESSVLYLVKKSR
ncbi:methyltransferase domain-containing protein [Winogradskyella sp. 3972H.M.0a.05]|uniref:methyltransferase domain-containing protein n=1 Tax=Winogradskyella sp. 3972H.M.0a.05 TaxID=2950277 RepID=UPI003394830E